MELFQKRYEVIRSMLDAGLLAVYLEIENYPGALDSEEARCKGDLLRFIEIEVGRRVIAGAWKTYVRKDTGKIPEPVTPPLTEWPTEPGNGE